MNFDSLRQLFFGRSLTLMVMVPLYIQHSLKDKYLAANNYKNKQYVTTMFQVPK